MRGMLACSHHNRSARAQDYDRGDAVELAAHPVPKDIYIECLSCSSKGNQQ